MTTDIRTAAASFRPEMRFFNGMIDEDYGSGRGASGVRITPDNAIESAAVLACVRVLAESIAALPLHLYRRLPGGGKERVTEHPLARVLGIQPNGWQTSFEWRETSMAHLGLWGNAYSEIRSGAAGAVTELWPLHPSRMDVERVENGRLRYSYSEPDGRKTVYTQDQIFHVRWLSSDSLVGMIPTQLCREAIGVARACEMHAARYFGNGARPGVVLETDANLTPEAARELRENWERVHRGPDKNGKTAVLMGGLKAHELGQSNESSQFIEARRFQIEEICRVYRVPPHLVQSLDRATFSNIEQQSLDFVQHTLLGWIRRWESAIARDLLTDESLFVEFDVRGLLRGDAATRASYYNTMAMLGVLSVNEVRGLESLNPVEGGDSRFVQLNMQPLTAAAPGAPAAPAAAPAEGEPEPAAGPEPAAAAIASSSLNGAQVASLLEILASLSSGLLTPDGAKAIILASFPTVSPQTIEQIVSGVVPGAAASPAGPPVNRAAPSEIAEGDWVAWGEGLIGRVDHVMVDGVLNLGEVEMPASADAPVALVSVWDGSGFAAPQGVAVADLQKVEPPSGYEVRSESRFDPDQPRDPDGKWGAGGAGGSGGDGGGSGGDSGGGSSDQPQGNGRRERLRDRIEGTQAEADREVVKYDRKVKQIEKKIAEVKAQANLAEAKAKVAVAEKALTEVRSRAADLRQKLAESQQRMAELKARLKRRAADDLEALLQTEAEAIDRVLSDLRSLNDDADAILFSLSA